MKTCLHCKVSFAGHGNRIYCSARCAQVASTHNKSLVQRYPELMEELSRYGVRSDKLPEKITADMLEDLIFAMKVITKR